MTGADLAEWEVFERLHGPILVQERVDFAMAVISATIRLAAGDADADPRKLLPRWDEKLRELEDEQGIMELFTGLAGKGGEPRPSPR